ncbi:MAG: ABC transporter ATP-binding protein [Myxococcales bacterium]|nr:ABC transporter ATP-binding protein [Myxococcales bacterium]
MALIEFHDVYKAFGPKVVYKGLSLAIERGETFTILGGSGVGKSVMLKLLIGLLKPDAGSIVFDGERVETMGPKALQRLRQRVGMVFQGAALFDSLSVRENVAYGLREHFNMDEASISERVAWALSLVGLPGVESMNPADLSGGMRKRVGLARTIALQPEVLLYDEPTTGLDPINISRINHLITSLEKALNITSVVVTHDMSTAFSVSHRLAMVHKGRIIATGTRDEFRASTVPLVHQFITGQAPEDEDMAALVGRTGQGDRAS